MSAPDRAARFRGALVGLAVGDALGTSVEFKPPGSFTPVTDMVGGGPFALPAGAWTDDTSMALCLADSLLARRGFDPLDQLERYRRWYRDGERSSTGRCFDIGNATRAAIERFERTGEPYPGDAAPDAAGNGPLMKLAPVALAYARHPPDAVRLAALSARTTHGAPEAADAARCLAAMLVSALNGAGRQAILDGEPLELLGGEPIHPLVADVVDGSFLDREPPEIHGGGYVVDALEAALWALRRTATFEDGVLAAVNLGDDADTTAAIYGQLAGAIYGIDAIPAPWRERLVLRGEIMGLADGLLGLSEELGIPDAAAAGPPIESNDGRPIATRDEWHALAPPAASNHWREHRSAYELARAWTEGDGAQRLQALLATRAEFAGVELERAIAERRTWFDDIPGGPRNHDLLVLGRVPAGRVVVGIEAKADETFDRDLADFVSSARRRSSATRAPERLDRLTRAFFGATLDDEPTLAPLRYQLFSALAGTLAEAGLCDAAAAVLVVHEFVTPETDAVKQRRNAEDLEAFLARLGPASRSRLGDDGWLAGPFAVPGGARLPGRVPVYVGKLVTRR